MADAAAWPGPVAREAKEPGALLLLAVAIVAVVESATPGAMLAVDGLEAAPSALVWEYSAILAAAGAGIPVVAGCGEAIPVPAGEAIPVPAEEAAVGVGLPELAGPCAVPSGRLELPAV